MAEFKTIPTQFVQHREKPVPATNITQDREQGITVWDHEKGCFVVRREGEPDILLYCEQPALKPGYTFIDLPNFLGSE